MTAADLDIDYKQLSKTVAHAIRHAPHLYELELDDQGWVDIEHLLDALRSRRRAWRHIGEPEIAHMVATSSKKRYEMDGAGRVRALYGHSTPQRLAKTPGRPPAILYHGTSPEIAAVIREEGLKPMSRQYVHLSVDKDTALEVGHRKDGAPVLLEIEATRAHDDGVLFYEGNEYVWLADFVSPDYIR